MRTICQIYKFDPTPSLSLSGHALNGYTHLSEVRQSRSMRNDGEHTESGMWRGSCGWPTGATGKGSGSRFFNLVISKRRLALRIRGRGKTPKGSGTESISKHSISNSVIQLLSFGSLYICKTGEREFCDNEELRKLQQHLTTSTKTLKISKRYTR